jgi:hypothetical protein
VESIEKVTVPKLYGRLENSRENADEMGEAAGGILRAVISGGRKKDRFDLDDRLKELMQDLGNAINESLSDSDRIAEAIGEIKRAGYDVFLVLEATIGFNKREEGATDEEFDESVEMGSEEMGEAPKRVRSGKLSWTSQDQKFLRALKISLDDEANR